MLTWIGYPSVRFFSDFFPSFCVVFMNRKSHYIHGSELTLTLTFDLAGCYQQKRSTTKDVICRGKNLKDF
jgi:hypothetical protein